MVLAGVVGGCGVGRERVLPTQTMAAATARTALLEGEIAAEGSLAQNVPGVKKWESYRGHPRGVEAGVLR